MTTLRASVLVLALAAGLPAGAAEPLVVGRFSAFAAGDGLPPGWEPVRFRNVARATDYRLVDDGGVVVMRAESRAAASALVRPVSVDTTDYPVLQWRWKVAAPVPGEIGRREADDFAARVYVGFAEDPQTLGAWERLKVTLIRFLYGRTPPLAVLNYVWADTEPVGTVAPSPFTARVRLVVVESGAQRAGEWVTVRRDLVVDYRRAFGRRPPPVTDIGIMTDTDGTGTDATAYYGDIALLPAGRATAGGGAPIYTGPASVPARGVPARAGQVSLDTSGAAGIN
jgi:hypothetical protein